MAKSLDELKQTLNEDASPKFNIGDRVKSGENCGTVEKVVQMKLSKTPTYRIKLDDGKEIDRYEEELSLCESEDIEKEDKDKFTSMLQQSIAEEYEASANYVKRAAKCEEHGLEDAAKLFKDIAAEEMVHVGEFQALMEKYGVASAGEIAQGEEEAAEILMTDENSKVASEETYIHKVTRDEWNKTHDDYKTIINGKKYMMYIDPFHHKTVLGPVEIIDEKPTNEEFLDKSKIYSRIIRLLDLTTNEDVKAVNLLGDVIDFMDVDQAQKFYEFIQEETDMNYDEIFGSKSESKFSGLKEHFMQYMSDVDKKAPGYYKNQFKVDKEHEDYKEVLVVAIARSYIQDMDLQDPLQAQFNVEHEIEANFEAWLKEFQANESIKESCNEQSQNIEFDTDKIHELVEQGKIKPIRFSNIKIGDRLLTYNGMYCQGILKVEEKATLSDRKGFPMVEVTGTREEPAARNSGRNAIYYGEDSSFLIVSDDVSQTDIIKNNKNESVDEADTRLHVIQYNKAQGEKEKTTEYYANDFKEVKKIFANSHELNMIEKIEVFFMNKLYATGIPGIADGEKRWSIQWVKSKADEAAEPLREPVMKKFEAYIRAVLKERGVEDLSKYSLEDVERFVYSENVFFHQLAIAADYGDDLEQNPNFQGSRKAVLNNPEATMTLEEDKYFWDLNDARHWTLAKQVAKRLKGSNESDHNKSEDNSAQYGVQYRSMHTGIHNLIITDNKEHAERILNLLKELEDATEETDVYGIWNEINEFSTDCIEINYRDTEDGTYGDIIVINGTEPKPDIYESADPDTVIFYSVEACYVDGDPQNYNSYDRLVQFASLEDAREFVKEELPELDTIRYSGLCIASSEYKYNDEDPDEIIDTYKVLEYYPVSGEVQKFNEDEEISELSFLNSGDIIKTKDGKEAVIEGLLYDSNNIHIGYEITYLDQKDSSYEYNDVLFDNIAEVLSRASNENGTMASMGAAPTVVAGKGAVTAEPTKICEELKALRAALA